MSDQQPEITTLTSRLARRLVEHGRLSPEQVEKAFARSLKWFLLNSLPGLA